MVGEQKQPGFEWSFVSVEPVDRTVDIDEDLLNAVFGLSVITQNAAGHTEDYAAMTFE
jgi:hypothetical protein